MKPEPNQKEQLPACLPTQKEQLLACLSTIEQCLRNLRIHLHEILSAPRAEDNIDSRYVKHIRETGRPELKVVIHVLSLMQDRIGFLIQRVTRDYSEEEMGHRTWRGLKAIKRVPDDLEGLEICKLYGFIAPFEDGLPVSQQKRLLEIPGSYINALEFLSNIPYFAKHTLTLIRKMKPVTETVDLRETILNFRILQAKSEKFLLFLLPEEEV